CLSCEAHYTVAATGHDATALSARGVTLGFLHPESFERQLGDRVTKRLKSPRAPPCSVLFRKSKKERKWQRHSGTSQRRSGTSPRSASSCSTAPGACCSRTAA